MGAENNEDAPAMPEVLEGGLASERQRTMIKETYQDVQIEYRENDNAWIFELGGRERVAKSLREAKNAIDTAPKPKKQAVRFQAYLISWDSKIEEVTVGAASKNYRGQPQFWVSNDGQRSKEDAARLVKMNGANAPIIAEIQRLSGEINGLIEQRTAQIALLERVDIPTEENASESDSGALAAT